MIRPLFIVWCRLKTFEAASETVIISLLDHGPSGSNVSPLYGEKSWNVFIKNLNFLSTEERKTWTSWMTWGRVNYQQKFFQK